MPELAIILPCYNEAGNVEALVAHLEAALAGIAWEAIFVDDNSPDGTSVIAKAVAGGNPRVRCIRRIGRRGLSSACIEGMLSTAAPYVAVMDADLQHDETLLPAMLQALRAGECDLVIGSRNIAGGDKAGGLTAFRRAISDGGATMANILLRQPVSDPMSGFFAMRRAVFDDIAPRLTGIGFKILLDIILSAPAPLTIKEIAYKFRPRHAGDSKLNLSIAIDFLFLLADKLFGKVIPVRFFFFALIGLLGVLIHVLLLGAGYRLLQLEFGTAQWLATFATISLNFALNNTVTYRDRRLRGAALLRGLLIFYAVCGLGAAAQVGIASLLIHNAPLSWSLAGAAGAALTVVWNYAVSATLVWRER